MAKYTRTPYLIVHQEKQARKDVYGSVGDSVVLQAQLLRGERDSDTAVVAMHPIGSPGYLPMFSQLARQGLHVIACATRYSNGDAALQMENVLLDLGACIRDARERLGYRKIVLAGWSGGGSLMAGYQAEAEKPQITRTAAGEPTALADTALLPADAVLLMAAHRSRHHLLTEFLDPSILDEHDPRRPRDPQLHLYDPNNPHQPPYSEDFLVHYREAQRRRNRRITAWVKEELESAHRRGDEHGEHCFVVQGTMADPRWIDPTVEPNGRTPGWSYLGDPAIVNDSPAGLARYTTLRSWLSQWSLDDAQVDAVDAAPRISVPVLITANGRDDACPTSHIKKVFAAIGHSEKEFHELPDANHYFSGSGQQSHLQHAADIVTSWLNDKGLN